MRGTGEISETVWTGRVVPQVGSNRKFCNYQVTSLSHFSSLFTSKKVSVLSYELNNYINRSRRLQH